MGPTCKNMNLCCENGHFNMGSMDICSLLGPAPSGFSMYCSFSHFRVGFIVQIRMLPLDRYIYRYIDRLYLDTYLGTYLDTQIDYRYIDRDRFGQIDKMEAPQKRCRTSVVWEHFRLETPNKARCVYCDRQQQYIIHDAPFEEHSSCHFAGCRGWHSPCTQACY